MRLAAVILPDLGTGPDVPIIVSHWFVARGGRVWEGERLVEVLAGPATFDVPSPVTGRLAEIRGLEDDRVEAGSVLGWWRRPKRLAAVPRRTRRAASAGRNRRSVAPGHDHVA